MSDYWKDNGISKPQSVIICAACKHPHYKLMVVGPRHWDRVMNTQYDSFDKSLKVNAPLWEQGFIDQFGKFFTREDAMKIAQEAGQKIDIGRGCGGDENTLYSEGLY